MNITNDNKPDIPHAAAHDIHGFILKKKQKWLLKNELIGTLEFLPGTIENRKVGAYLQQVTTVPVFISLHSN